MNKHGHEGCVMALRQDGTVFAYDHIGPIAILSTTMDDCGEKEVARDIDAKDLTRDDDEKVYALTRKWTVRFKCEACQREWTYCTDRPQDWIEGTFLGYSTRSDDMREVKKS